MCSAKRSGGQWIPKSNSTISSEVEVTEPYEPIGRKSRKLEGSVVLPNSAAASFLSSPYRSAKVVTFPMSSTTAVKYVK